MNGGQAGGGLVFLFKIIPLSNPTLQGYKATRLQAFYRHDHPNQHLSGLVPFLEWLFAVRYRLNLIFRPIYETI